MIDLIFRFVNMFTISVLYVRTTSKWWKLVFKPNELVYIHDLIRKMLFVYDKNDQKYQEYVCID